MNSMQVLCFLKAAELLNFTEAAAALHISQPAFSRNIALLEEEWQVALFLRSNKQKATSLTPAGQEMYDGMTVLTDRYEVLLSSAQSIHAGKSGTLTVGLISSDRIDDRTLRALDRFQEANPRVELSLRRGNHSDLIRWLQDHTIDIAFCLEIDIADKPWISAAPFSSVDSVMLLSSTHPLLEKELLTLSDFRDEVFLNVSSKESPALNAMLATECEKAGFTPKTVDAANISEQLLYLESRRGVAIGSVNNTAGYNTSITMRQLPELRPMNIVVAHNVENQNPCTAVFYSGYEPIE